MKKNSIHLKIDTESSPLAFSFNEMNLDKSCLTLLQGSNGVGKSTLLNSVNYEILDYDVAYCFQDELESFSNLTLSELGKTFSFIYSIFNQKEFYNLLGSLLDENKIVNYLEKSISAFSGGEKQMIKLALFLSFESDLYLFDEPFNHLSKIKIEFVKTKILELVSNGKTVLIVDHGKNFDLENISYSILNLQSSKEGKIELKEESQ